MGSGAGRGKFKGKPTGKRSFSTPEEMASGSNAEPKWRAARKLREGEEESSSEEEISEDESDDSAKEEEDKSKGVAGLIQTENPNAVRKTNLKVGQVDASLPTQLSRREREEIQKQAAKERYMKLQEEGKTEQAQKDLERLSLIRKQREEAAKRREEEKQAKEAKQREARK